MESSLLLGLLAAPATLVSIALGKGLYRSWISPLSIYGAVWGIASMLYASSPLPWPPIQDRTVWAILLTWMAFALGCITIGIVPKRRSLAREFKSSEPLLKKAIIAFSILGLMGSVSALTRVVIHFGLERIIASPWLIRHELTLSGGQLSFVIETQVLFAFTVAACALGGLYMALYEYRWFVALPLLAGAIYEMSRLGRWELLLLLLLYFFGFVIGRQSKDNPIRIPAGVLSTFGMGIVFIVLMSFFVAKSGEYLVPMAKIPLPPPILAVINRLNVPLHGLDWVLNHESPTELGRNLFYPFAKTFYLFAGLNLPSHTEFSLRVNPLFPQWGERFQGTSYLGFVYWDFGWIGIMVFPWVLGVVSSVLFFRRSLVSRIALVFIYVMLVQSYAVWYAFYPFFVAAFFLALGIGILASRSETVLTYPLSQTRNYSTLTPQADQQ